MTVDIKEPLTVKEIADAVGGRLVGNDLGIVDSVTTDSRDVKENSLFVAIKGEHFDGNDFIGAAAECGASCVVTEKEPGERFGTAAVITDNSVKALGRIAAEYKNKIAPLTVAVTGSIGKTTTKEFIWSVLSEKYKTLKTDGNYNNNIGLPMTLMGLDHSYSAAVVEMGMSHFGEIRELSKIARPNIAVITNIGSSHIGNLGSREGIRDAKLEILCGLQPGGAIILNGDEPLLSGIEGACYVGKENRDCDVFVDNMVFGINGSAFDLTIKGEKVESIVIPALGEHNIMNAAMAYAVGLYAGMGEFEIRRGLKNYHTVGMRQNICDRAGRHIIEDCYNASPESTIASLKVLCEIADARGLRPVAVLGDMRELGDFSSEEHSRVGKFAAGAGLSLLVTFGKEAHVIADAAIKSGMTEGSVVSFDDLDDVRTVAGMLLGRTDGSDIILFKASRAVRMERIIEAMENGCK